MAKDRKHRHDTEAQLKALGHEMRRAIMEVFVGKGDDTPISPREVSGVLQQPLSNVSYHVRVLADCEAITLVSTQTRSGLDAAFLPAVREVHRTALGCQRPRSRRHGGSGVSAAIRGPHDAPSATRSP